MKSKIIYLLLLLVGAASSLVALPMMELTGEEKRIPPPRTGIADERTDPRTEGSSTTGTAAGATTINRGTGAVSVSENSNDTPLPSGDSGSLLSNLQAAGGAEQLTGLSNRDLITAVTQNATAAGILMDRASTLKSRPFSLGQETLDNDETDNIPIKFTPASIRYQTDSIAAQNRGDFNESDRLSALAEAEENHENALTAATEKLQSYQQAGGGSTRSSAASTAWSNAVKAQEDAINHRTKFKGYEVSLPHLAEGHLKAANAGDQYAAYLAEVATALANTSIGIEESEQTVARVTAAAEYQQKIPALFIKAGEFKTRAADTEADLTTEVRVLLARAAEQCEQAAASARKTAEALYDSTTEERNNNFLMSATQSAVAAMKALEDAVTKTKENLSAQADLALADQHALIAKASLHAHEARRCFKNDLAKLWEHTAIAQQLALDDGVKVDEASSENVTLRNLLIATKESQQQTAKLRSEAAKASDAVENDATLDQNKKREFLSLAERWSNAAEAQQSATDFRRKALESRSKNFWDALITAAEEQERVATFNINAIETEKNQMQAATKSWEAAATSQQYLADIRKKMASLPESNLADASSTVAQRSGLAESEGEEVPSYDNKNSFLSDARERLLKGQEDVVNFREKAAIAMTGELPDISNAWTAAAAATEMQISYERLLVEAMEDESHLDKDITSVKDTLRDAARAQKKLADLKSKVAEAIMANDLTLRDAWNAVVKEQELALQYNIHAINAAFHKNRDLQSNYTHASEAQQQVAFWHQKAIEAGLNVEDRNSIFPGRRREWSNEESIAWSATAEAQKKVVSYFENSIAAMRNEDSAQAMILTKAAEAQEKFVEYKQNAAEAMKNGNKDLAELWSRAAGAQYRIAITVAGGDLTTEENKDAKLRNRFEEQANALNDVK